MISKTLTILVFFIGVGICFTRLAPVSASEGLKDESASKRQVEIFQPLRAKLASLTTGETFLGKFLLSQVNLPDLVVKSFETEIVLPGQPTTEGTFNKKTIFFIWTVENRGDTAANASKLVVTWAERIGNGGWHNLSPKTFDIKPLFARPGTPLGAQKVWWWIPAPDENVQHKYSFAAYIDPGKKITEKNENNNALFSNYVYPVQPKLQKRPQGVFIESVNKPRLKAGTKAPVVMKKLWLKSPHGMETWYIGETYPIEWQSTGIEGRIRIILKDRHGKTQTLNGMIGTNVLTARFSWKIGSNIKPGSMYTIYLVTTDGKIKSTPSGGFNIKMKLNPSPAKKALEKKTKPKLNAPPKGTHHRLQ